MSADKKITWEVDEYFEKLSVYDHEVSLIGIDEKGVEYTAFGVLSCDSIEDVTEIEIVNSMKYRGYRIEPNLTGYVNFDFYPDEAEKITGNGKTLKECRDQIDQIIDDQND